MRKQCNKDVWIWGAIWSRSERGVGNYMTRSFDFGRDQSKTYMSVGESVPLLLCGGITSDEYKHLQAGVHQEHVLQSQEIIDWFMGALSCIHIISSIQQSQEIDWFMGALSCFHIISSIQQSQEIDWFMGALSSIHIISAT